MTHELWRERLALHVYGELDASEVAELERHLAQCAACRALEAQLRSGLVRLAHPLAGKSEDEAWVTSLRDSVGARIESGRATSVRGFGFGLAAGLAAGVLAAFAWGTSHRAPSDAPMTSASLARPSPPPLARAGGELARLGEYLRR